MEITAPENDIVRFSVFAGMFVLMAVAEHLFPRKKRVQTRKSRWITNWSLTLLNSLALRIVFPVLAVGMAAYAEEQSWGLFNKISVPMWLELGLAIVILDLAIWVQHLASHKLSLIWRFHKVHHVDRDMDVTTSIRFHPGEILLSMAYKMILVILIGPAVLAVFLFEVILNAAAIFSHANLRIPRSLDRVLRLVIVTPDMHRVHHSTIVCETDSNYGNFLSLWDRLLGTYVNQPKNGHDGMVIGLEGQQTDAPSSLLWSLALPFKIEAGNPGSNSIEKRNLE